MEWRRCKLVAQCEKKKKKFPHYEHKNNMEKVKYPWGINLFENLPWKRSSKFLDWKVYTNFSIDCFLKSKFKDLYWSFFTRKKVQIDKNFGNLVNFSNLPELNIDKNHQYENTTQTQIFNLIQNAIESSRNII